MESAHPRIPLRTAALLLAAPLVGVAARAQCSYPDIQLGNFICTPTSTSGAYTSITSGDLNDNFSPEVAVTRGDGSLIVYHDVDSENVAVVVATDAIDVCYSPSAMGPNSPGLFYTSTAGLRSVVYDATTKGYVTAAVASTSLWQATTRIRWAKAGIGASGLQGLVGWAPSLDTLFFSTVVGGVVGQTSQFTYTPDVTDLVLLDWDGVAGLELAVLHGTGLHVLDQSGTVLLSRAASVPGDAITAVRCNGYKDSLAWVTRMPNGTSALLLFNLDFPGNHFQGPLLLGTDVYHSIAAGDLISAPTQGSGTYVGPDGDEDLVLASTTASALRIYKVDTSAQGDWISGTYRTMDLTGPVGTATPTGPALCDNLFNDWTPTGVPIPSFAVALSTPNGLRVKPEPMARPNPLIEDYTAVEYRSGMHVDGCLSNAPNSASEWNIELGDGWGITTATEIQVIVRICEEGEDEVEPGVYFSAVVPLQQQGQITNTPISFVGLETSQQFDCETSERKYFVKVRPRSATQAWRWSIISVSPSCFGMEWLRNLPGASETVLQIADFSYCTPDLLLNCPGFSGGEYIPVAVPQLFIPSSPGVLPGPPPPQ